MADLRIVLGASIVLVALMLVAASRRLGRPGSVASTVAVVLALEAALLVPHHVRDLILGITIVALVVAGARATPWTALVGALSMGMLMLVLSRIPGGNVAVVLAILALVGVFRIRAGLRLMARVRRAGALVPDERPAGDVQLGGKAVGQPIPVPLDRGVEAAWWAIESPEEREHVTSGPLRIASDAGTVMAELEGAALRMSNRHARFVRLEGQMDLQAVLGRGDRDDKRPMGHDDRRDDGRAGQAAPPALKTDAYYSVYWLEPGADVYVVGTPSWERAPADVAGYRDAPLIPVFRGKHVYVADASADKAVKDAIWSLMAWSAWMPVCAALGGLQLASII